MADVIKIHKVIENELNLTDILLGPVQMDGQRKFGKGIDSFRFWACAADKTLEAGDFIQLNHSDFEQSSRELSMIRQVLFQLIKLVQKETRPLTMIPYEDLPYVLFVSRNSSGCTIF